MIYLEDGKVVPVDKSELPVKLPDDIDIKGNPLDSHPSWKYTVEKSSGKKAIRETDTLDTFLRFFLVFFKICHPTKKHHLLTTKNEILDACLYWWDRHAILHILF